MKASDQFKVGDALLGGAAVVLAVKGDYVLCVMPGNDKPFVTWWVDARGQVLSGAYHKELGDAVRDLGARAYRASGDAA
ncbi:hypothetical protein UFOVP6_3 [uncultured Caudovirales phage]|uniref:Uncharacterized protein n=1 Tax=uncultured Caudovirales phage TaxID=2100421 RepID=A0A6J5KHN8_9CAUD|nr:hypothetical protein UFOVP6_3 [uncultured Caudovirales phage]